MSNNYGSFFIGGRWRAASSSNRITVISPNDETVIAEVAEGTSADIDAAVGAARAAFDDPSGWAHWAPANRAEAMNRLADALDAQSAETAQTVSSQNGMPISIANQLEGSFPQVYLRYFASLVADDSGEEVRPGLLGGSALVTKSPVGVVGAIVPWNFPQAIAANKYAPALAAGCTIVLKPSPETVLDSYLLGRAVQAAGIPDGVINIVTGGRDVGAYLVGHPDVDKISFTGSTAAGKSIGEVCGGLLRPVTLELGGKSAALILEDADLDLSKIGEKLFVATFMNNGQACYLSTRILAPRSRYSEVVDLFTGFAESMSIGNSLSADTQIGPMVSARHRDRVESYIAKGRSDGARVTTGGGRPKGLDSGWFVEPTVFADVDNNSTIAQEEIFGPVLSVIPYDGEDEAVRIANASDYGLAGSVWTEDHDRAVRVARQIQTGAVGINGFMPDPTAPFGGVKSSGVGLECGPEGLAAFVQLKSIYL